MFYLLFLLSSRNIIEPLISNSLHTMLLFSRLMPVINWIRRHKYWFVTAIFLVIVVFIDDKSIIRHFENRHRISTLEEEIALMKRDSIEFERKNKEIDPNGDIHEIEKICREKHNMHAENEDIIIIEE